MDQFVDVVRDAFSTTLSQCSGKTWECRLADSGEPSTEHWVQVTTSGGLSGAFAVGFDSAMALKLAQSLLMTTELPASFGAEEQEAVIELFRQVCGQAATPLRSRFKDISFEATALETLPWKSARDFTLSVRVEDWDGTLKLAFDSELYSCLTAEAAPAAKATIQQAISTGNLDLLMDVQLGVRLRFGSRSMRLREILELHPGTVVELDRQIQDPVDLLVDSKLIARGEVVVIDGNYGLNVTEVASSRSRVEAIQ